MEKVINKFLKFSYRVFLFILPFGIVYFLRYLKNKLKAVPIPDSLLAPNAKLKGRHEGERCFILGNAPSAKLIDLTLLRGEIVLSVSSGYLHKGYSEIAPRYHCVPQITYHGQIKENILNWLKEMHENLGGAELFLNETEASVVKENNLFSGRKVYYLALRESIDTWVEKEIIDITKPTPNCQSVPIMALFIAMYMGFKEIVLLGIDHDNFITGEYNYAFSQGPIVKAKSNTGRNTTPLHDDLQALAYLWRQYRAIRNIAEKNGIRIINATPGGALDEFPREELNTVLSRKKQIG